MATVNLRDAYRQATTVLTGDFQGRIVGAEARISTSGNEMINLTLQIEGGPHHGFTTTDRLVMSPKTMVMFFERIAIMGLKGDWFDPADGKPVPTLEATAQELIGRPVGFTLVKGKEFRGRVKEEVSYYREPSGDAQRTVPGVPGIPSGVPTGIPAVPSTPSPAPAPSQSTPASVPASPVPAVAKDVPPPPADVTDPPF